MGAVGESDSLRWRKGGSVMDLFRKPILQRGGKGEFGRVRASPGEDIAEKGIVICYERGLEIRLGIGVVLEGRTLGAHLGPRFLVRVGSFADTT